jgi:hypothetical protein
MKICSHLLNIRNVLHECCHCAAAEAHSACRRSTLPAQQVASIWEVSLPVASLFIAWGISIVVLCTQDICIDRLWMEVSLAGCYASIALGGIAYMIDLLILDSPNEPIRLDESILTRP